MSNINTSPVTDEELAGMISAALDHSTKLVEFLTFVVCKNTPLGKDIGSLCGGPDIESSDYERLKIAVERADILGRAATRISSRLRFELVIRSEVQGKSPTE